MTSLEAFKELVKSYTTIFNMALNRPRDTIVNWGGVDKIEKELKALEIIKRGYDVGDLSYDDDTNTYYYQGTEITKEESKLLWEILTND